MYNPRFPHTLVVKRAERNSSGEIVYDANGDATYSPVTLTIANYANDEPIRLSDGTFSTYTAESIKFGYRTSSQNTKAAGDAVMSDFKLATPMFFTELLYDDIIEITDYDKSYKARLVKKTTFNWGTNIWIDEIRN